MLGLINRSFQFFLRDTYGVELWETVAKVALYLAMREAGITNMELAKKLGVDEKEVRRLLDPHYGSKLPRIAEAISLLGQRLVIDLARS